MAVNIILSKKELCKLGFLNISKASFCATCNLHTSLHAELIILPHCSPKGWLKSILLHNIFKSYPLENVSLRLFDDLRIKRILFLKICIHYLLSECEWVSLFLDIIFFILSIEIMVNSSNISRKKSRVISCVMYEYSVYRLIIWQKLQMKQKNCYK